ncbi:MAG: futalosine hydrolase [Desulfopila sp.]|jgi:futalosine hydrolase|nr:futalosine hydrolase [Desulfopila sp.]
MILAVAATEFELAPFAEAIGNVPCRSLISGVGPVESCLRLTRFLERHGLDISMVIHFGVAGAYIHPSGKMPALLDLCLAETEVLGDVGICFPRRIDSLPEEIAVQNRFSFEPALCRRAYEVLRQNNLQPYCGNFVTVSCVSGTLERGEMLRCKYDALCENMEGAAIARVCSDFSLPLLEIRSVSNFVEDRNPERWKLEKACAASGRAAAMLVEALR